MSGVTADVRVEIVDAPADLDELTSWAVTPSTGAVVSFLGTVRDHSPGLEGVTAIDYEVYEQLCRTRLEDIAERCRHAFPDVVRLALVHRRGVVALGEPSVWVVASAGHRPSAFDAAAYCIDVLKETVPVWKREITADGRRTPAAGTPVVDVTEAHDRWFERRSGTV
jgi:molybdopterin synthase catalytic subunit